MAEYYLEPDEMATFYDVRRLQELLSDTGEELAVGDVENSPVLLQMIIAATGEINTVVLQGRRYTEQNLQDIIEAVVLNPTDKIAKANKQVLNQLTADLVFGMILARRGYGPDVMERLAPRYKTAQATLEALYRGEKVFNVTGALDAGVPAPVRIGGNGYVPSRDNKLFGIFWDSPYGGWYDPRSRVW